MTLHSLPAEARPREKLLARGAGALADAELLALLLRTGLQGQGVLQLAQTTLDAMGGIGGLLDASDASLQAVKGLGPAKRAELIAIAEIARRATAQRLREQPVMSNPQLVSEQLQLLIASRAHECFVVLFLDAHMRLITHEELFRGTIDAATVYPREVVVRALHHHASAVILAHNHPTGSTQPSAADQQITRRIEAALATLDMRVLDHFIVTRGACASLREQGGW
jgi:DNA repair protein RadC